jgi:hypothetical protein
MQEATSPCAGSMCNVADAQAAGHPGVEEQRASCARYFRDFDRLVGLSTRVRPVFGQPAQISTEFQSRLVELTWEQTKIAVELSCRGVRTRRGLCQRALLRGGQGCPKANRVRTARTSHQIPRNSVSTYCTCIRRSSQSRTGGIATPYPRRRYFYDQRLTTSSCRHWVLHSSARDGSPAGYRSVHAGSG